MISPSHAAGRRTLLALSAVAILVGLRFLTAAGHVEGPGVLRVERPLMGTLWTIEVVDHGRVEAAHRAIEEAFAELRRIDALMSEWKPDSPLSAINAAAGRDAVEVPAELRAIIERGIRYGELSDGAFDITWHAMKKIWHFDDSFVPPSREQVAAARRNVDYRAIQIDGNRVRLPRHGMSIGLGGIAKGYAVDRAARVLAGARFHDSLVDGGGDVLASGTRDGRPWRLGIQHPRRERGSLMGVLSVSNQALVTSGDYERFRIAGGVRYHHIIDARTGWPANASQSVTVLSPTAEQGVVLAKVAFILGPEKGLAAARAQGVEALLIDAHGRRYATPAFTQFPAEKDPHDR